MNGETGIDFGYSIIHHLSTLSPDNSLAPGRSGCDLELANHTDISRIYVLTIASNIALKLMLQNPIDGMSA